MARRSPAEGPARWRRLEVGVLVGALVLRILGVWSVEASEFAQHLLVDAQTYLSQATSLERGGSPFRDGFYQPPGYPLFLVAVRSFTGRTESVLAVRLVQLLLGMATTWGLIRLGRKAGARMGARWMGAAAGALFVLYPSTLLFEQDLLTPALTQFAVVMALLLLWREGGPSPFRALLAGAILGTAAVVHTTLLAALGAAAVGLWIWKAPLRRRIGSLALGAGLALAPTTAINMARWGQLTLVSDNAGLNLYLGNNPDWKRTAFLQAGLPFRMLVMDAEPGTRRLTHERNAYWKARAWDEIAEAPGTWLGTLATKAVWSVNHREIPRNEDYRCRTAKGPLAWIAWLPVRYGWMFPLGFLGAMVLWRQKRAERMVPLFWAALHVPMIFFLVSDRYRIASWPLVCLCAAAGSAWVLQKWGEWKGGWRPARKHWPWLGLVVLPWIPIDSITDFDRGWCARVEGNFAVGDGDREEAVARYREALGLNPADISTRHHLAQTLLAEGKPSQAAGVLEPVLAVFPGSFAAQKLMAQIQRRMGQWEEVAEHAGRAHAIPHTGRSTDALYVEALVRTGREADARDVVKASPGLERHKQVRELLGL